MAAIHRQSPNATATYRAQMPPSPEANESTMCTNQRTTELARLRIATRLPEPLGRKTWPTDVSLWFGSTLRGYQAEWGPANRMGEYKRARGPLGCHTPRRRPVKLRVACWSLSCSRGRASSRPWLNNWICRWRGRTGT